MVERGLTDGSTAVAMAVTPRRIVVGNAGDSRAVVFDGPRAVPLSIDCKPSRPDEQRRIEAAGGHVMHLGVPRVNGILAVSRAIGDAELKHVVTSEPEVRSVRRTPSQWAAVLASDGLWDVLTADEVRAIVETHWGEEGRGAKQLADEAFARGSFDNICTMVVDLRAHGGAPPITAPGGASSSSEQEPALESNGATDELDPALAGYVLPPGHEAAYGDGSEDPGGEERGWAHSADYPSSEDLERDM